MPAKSSYALKPQKVSGTRSQYKHSDQKADQLAKEKLEYDVLNWEPLNTRLEMMADKPTLHENILSLMKAKWNKMYEKFPGN